MNDQMTLTDFVRNHIAKKLPNDDIADRMMTAFANTATCSSRLKALAYVRQIRLRDSTPKPMAVAKPERHPLNGINPMSMPEYMRQQFRAGVSQNDIVDQCVERYGVNRKGALGSFYAATKTMRLGPKAVAQITTEVKALAKPTDEAPEPPWTCKYCPECGWDLRRTNIAGNLGRI